MVLTAMSQKLKKCSIQPLFDDMIFRYIYAKYASLCVFLLTAIASINGSSIKYHLGFVTCVLEHSQFGCDIIPRSDIEILSYIEHSNTFHQFMYSLGIIPMILITSNILIELQNMADLKSFRSFPA